MVNSTSPAIYHLPQQITSFIGRDTEISEVVDHLNDPKCRLLTMTGFGGIGKTRLAGEAATRLTEGRKRVHENSFTDGIYFIDLTPLTSTDLIATTIMDRLGFPTSGTSKPIDQLVTHLGERKALLILDNFEHLMDGHWVISEILAHTLFVKILVTSRVRFNLPEETIYDLSGMTVPTTDEPHNFESYSALSLFQQIAQRVDWRFQLDNEQAPHVIRICRLVDGIPLAIEMAAAWVRVLPCRDIADGLARNFELLEATLDHFPDRHQSIRIVFEYSWNLLTDAERQVFQKMSVFRGGCSLDAAEYVADAKLNLLLALVDKSLIQYDSNQRYQMHELLRQFAEEKLTDNPQHAKKTQDLHCTYYADVLHEHTEEFFNYDHNSPAIALVRSDLDNIRSMWHWAIAEHNYMALDHAADSLFHHHVIQDTYGEAEDVFKKAAAMVEASDTSIEQDSLHTKLLSMQAYHAMYCGFYESAESDAQHARERSQSLGLLSIEARCLVTLGDIDLEHGNYAEARQHLEDATAIYATLDKTYEAQFAVLSLAWSYKALGEYDLARHHYQQLISANKNRDSDGLSGWILNSFGHLENLVKNYVSGLKYCTEAVSIFQRQEQLVGLLAGSKNLADAYIGLGQVNHGRDSFLVGLTAYVQHGEHVNSMIINTLARIANLFAYEGDITRAIELTAFVHHHPHINDETQTIADTLSNELEEELPPVIYQSAYARGKYLDLQPLIKGLIQEFSGETPDLEPTITPDNEDSIQLLQQVTDSLVTGKIFDDDLSEKEKDSVHLLLNAVDGLLEREKSRIMATFMESASHDLRTPLTIINTSLYLLERISDPEKKRDKIGTVKDQVKYLQNLIEDLIRMAQLDGGTELDLSPLDLNQLFDVIQQSDHATLLTNRDLDLQVDLYPEPLMVYADSDYLQRALLNIIENAVQHTPDGGSITIELRIDPKNIVVEIRDTGIGIAENDLPHIFERFYRADTARTERGRSGLGLAITQKIIEAHQGRIVVESTPDIGSVFQVVLPKIESDIP